MPDEIGKEAMPSDAPGGDESPSCDAAEDATTSVTEEKETEDGTNQEGQGPDVSGEPASGDETDAPEDLKLVVSIRDGKATIGVQRPSSDPHVETADDSNLFTLVGEIPAVIERAKAGWKESPKHPAYERPSPPAGRRSRRRQGTAQASNAEGEGSEAQQQTLRLF